jgi:hypothetical protein
MAYNVVTNSMIIYQIKKSSYFKINLGLSSTIERNDTRIFKGERRMKDKTLEELKEMLNQKRWELLDWLNSPRDYDDEIQKVADEMELIENEIKERNKK